MRSVQNLRLIFHSAIYFVNSGTSARGISILIVLLRSSLIRLSGILPAALLLNAAEPPLRTALGQIVCIVRYKVRDRVIRHLPDKAHDATAPATIGGKMTSNSIGYTAKTAIPVFVPSQKPISLNTLINASPTRRT